MKLTNYQREILHLLILQNDWAYLGMRTGTKKGVLYVNFKSARTLSKLGYVEKQDNRIRISRIGLDVMAEQS